MHSHFLWLQSSSVGTGSRPQGPRTGARSGRFMMSGL